MSGTASDDHLAALLARCGQGNRPALAELYGATSAKLFSVSLRIVRHRHLAEEVLQDAFVNIWNNAARYVPAQSAPMTWMATIVRNRSLDLVRRPVVEIPDENDAFAGMLPDPAAAPEDQLAARRDQSRINRCIRNLERDQRQAIALAFFRGLTHSEIAAHLKQPIGTVKTHIRRGLMKLKGCLEA